MYLENCPICGRERHTDSGGGKCLHCMSHIKEEMKRLGITIPSEWEYFYGYEYTLPRVPPDNDDLIRYTATKIVTAEKLIEAEKQYEGDELRRKKEEILKERKALEREIIDETTERLTEIWKKVQENNRKEVEKRQALRETLRDLQ